MSGKNFAELFEQSMAELDLRPGALVKATVVAVAPDRITVNVGLKSEDFITRKELGDRQVNVGDEIEVVIKSLENGFGETRLSFREAQQAKAWNTLERSYEAGEVVKGLIVEHVKGGFIVELHVGDDLVRAFLPRSLVDIKPVRDSGYLENKQLDFRVIKMDEKRSNVVVSRRAVMEKETSVEREKRLEELQEGQKVVGIVKNIVEYGAFVDLGGIDGLLHITDMSWKRVKHPSEMLSVGDELKVKILKFDRDKNRVSLGLKQLGEDPWINISRRYPPGTRLYGKVTNVTDYGCFVELEEGVEGLVHMSEMDWTNKNIHPSKVVTVGDEVEVIVLDIDEERRRISLGIKQTRPNPWQEFANHHEKGEKISGKIRSITDFGMFIGLDGGIDGLVHLSDISWTEPGEVAVRDYQKGQEVTAEILAIDPERERISLGIKQTKSNPVAEFIDKHEKDDVIKARVVEVDSKQAKLELAKEVIGILRITDYSHAKIKDLREKLNEGDELEVKVVNIDRKNFQIHVSHKILETKSAEEVKRSTTEETTKTTLGDLLKEQMREKENE